MSYNDYWSDIHHTLDVINIEKNVCESPIEFQFELKPKCIVTSRFGRFESTCGWKEWKEIHVNQKKRNFKIVTLYAIMLKELETFMCKLKSLNGFGSLCYTRKSYYGKDIGLMINPCVGMTSMC